MADLSKIKLNNVVYNIKDEVARSMGYPPLATQSTDGLMSAQDKQTLDNLNPNVIVTINNSEESNKLHIINAKAEDMLHWVGTAGPIIESQIRTSNYLNVNVELENAYINASGVITPSGAAGTDRLGPWIEVTPGADMYYTGITNPGAGSSQKFNRRLHVFDSNYNWIKQVSYVQVTGPNASWSTHGTLPANAAYVRLSWNVGDYNLMFSVGAPTRYEPYYLTPFDPITSVSLYVSSDDTLATTDTYIFNVPQALGNIYGLKFDAVTGDIQITAGHIASYNNETLPGRWWSDRDTYIEGTTPTVGAEVVYLLDEEDITETSGTGLSIPLNYHDNYFSIDNGITNSITYYAETLAADHVTIYNGATFGETYIVEQDIQNWNYAAQSIDDKAPINNPVLTGNPQSPTPGTSANSNQIATARFVNRSLGNIVAPLESSSTASANYSVGDYLIYNSQLYKVSAAITSGNTLTPGTNLVATNVATELTRQKTRITYSEDADNMQDLPTTETTYFTHTVTSAGDYLISYFLNASYDATSTIDRVVRFYIKKNGTTTLSKGRFTSTASHKQPASATVYANLAVGDVITMSAYCERDNCTPYGLWFMSIVEL